MVRVVVAGGTGNVAREVIDVLLKKNHNVTIFSRKNVSTLAREGLNAVQVDYTDKAKLVSLLRGVNTVLSFVIVASDPGNIAQKTLIDASIEAGVRRFAPNEWATRSNSGVTWYAGKDDVHEYLREVNKEKKVLEYTLFQPGLFLNYLSYPHKSAEHFHNTEMPIDFQDCRAIILDDGNDRFTLTTLQDLGAVLADAIEFDGAWPEVGGIRGGQITMAELVELGEKIRGKGFTVERVSKADLKSGILKTTWTPSFDHPNVTVADLEKSQAFPGATAKDLKESFSRVVVTGILLSIADGAWDVSDEWNQLLPQLKLTGIEEFTRSYWEDAT